MRTSIVFCIATILTIVGFNNCSAVHESNSELSSFEACNLILKDEFLKGYQPFLENNCNSCHVTDGSGNGAFADSDPDAAFDAFLVRGNKLVGDRAKDPNHQPPYSGPQHEGAIADLDSTWDTAKVQADLCVASAGGNTTEEQRDVIIVEDEKPTEGTILTFVKLMDAGKDAKTLTWNLETEIKKPSSLSFAGAELSIDVVANTTVTGEKSYIFSKPKLKAGTDSLQIIFIEFVINNQLVEDATSYRSISRRVPAGESRDIGVGSTTFGFDVRNTDTIALSIGVLKTIDFNPPTFAELSAPGGVFAANCLDCHGATNPQGGLDMSSRDAIMRQLMISPYSPNNSEIFKRMNDQNNPMPRSGLLPQADIDQVLHWIQDGAP